MPSTGDSIPTGGIIMWSGAIANIPMGWFICDGTNDTPDLRDKFIVGAGNTYVPAATGGSSTVDISHTHSVSNEGWGQGVTPASGRLLAGVVDGGASSSTQGVNTSSSGSSTLNITPPFYALAFIMKS